MLLMPDGLIDTKANVDKSLPLFRLAFRPLFWLGALFSVISIGLWALSFTGKLVFTPYGGGHFWHVHEMLFGFATAIISGFLLTAVQTWTKVPSIKGPTLMLLVAIWLLARIGLALPQFLTMELTILFDLSFLPLSALFLARPILKVKQWRNLIFVPIMLVMAVLNGLMHLSILGKLSLSYLHLSHIMVMMVALVMCIMGGRVFPMFTANGTRTPKVLPVAWLEKLALYSTGASVVVVADFLPIPSPLGAGVLFLAGVSNLVRALRWKVWVTIRTPLVWPLHLSYWAVSIGLILLSWVKFGVMDNASVALHAITVGGMGLMILAMISRVSLGHTGRMIQVGRVMNFAFLCMLAAAIIRVMALGLNMNFTTAILISALLWVCAYGLFVLKYAYVLFSPRIDGGPG